MRSHLLCFALLAPTLAACGTNLPSAVRATAPPTLGRVVVYRNGVAYFERTARVPGDTLTLSVPADKVDDFLKSLEVVDAKTGESANVAYPTDAKGEGGGMVDMQIQLAGGHPHEPHEVKLSYVTEAPAWKPSYRVVLGAEEKVDLSGWAVVDNTSGEDWRNVRLGVGASSALSFRFDLRSVRPVERETLQPEGLFAEAPPVEEAAKGAPASADVAPDKNGHARAPVVTRPPAGEGSLDPIGTSHFESTGAMTVLHGTSAMVSILHTQAEGEVVYLYDPESPRGSGQLAFKSLRLRNPTESQLEGGPVTVFGDGRLIGEGLSEPIPPKQLAFVPFALDRQVVVERSVADRDEVAGIEAVERGVFSTRVQHVRQTTLVVHNRLPSRTVVYVRHTVAAGFRASKAPTDPEHAAGADLYRVEVDGYGREEVVLEEAAPVSRAIDIRTSDGMQLVHTFLATSRDATLKAKVDRLASLQEAITSTDRRAAALRGEVAEHRRRIEDLKGQIAAAHGARTGSALTASLQVKQKQMGEEITRAAAELAELDERQLLSHIELQDGASELTVDALTVRGGSLASRGE